MVQQLACQTQHQDFRGRGIHVGALIIIRIVMIVKVLIIPIIMIAIAIGA